MSDGMKSQVHSVADKRPAPYRPPQMRNVQSVAKEVVDHHIRELRDSSGENRYVYSAGSSCTRQEVTIHDKTLAPEFCSVICFESSEQLSSASADRVTLQVLPHFEFQGRSCNYFPREQTEAIFFHSRSTAPLSGTEVFADSCSVVSTDEYSDSQTIKNAGPLEELSLKRSSSLTSDVTNESLPLANRRIAGSWSILNYEDVLLHSLIKILDDGVREEESSFRRRLKIDICIAKYLFKFCLGREALNTEMPVATPSPRSFSVPELQELQDCGIIKPIMAADRTTTMNIENAKTYLKKSHLQFEKVEQQSSKIDVSCADHANNCRYKVTILYQANVRESRAPETVHSIDCSIHFTQESQKNPSFKDDKEGMSRKVDINEDEKFLGKRWTEDIQAIKIIGDHKRHCSVVFLRKNTASDYRLTIDIKQVIDTSLNCYHGLVRWIERAWALSKEKQSETLVFPSSRRFRIKGTVRHRHLIEVYKSQNYKVTMTRNIYKFWDWKTQCVSQQWDWTVVLGCRGLNAIFEKGFTSVDAMAVIIPLIHDLVNEGTNLSLAMGEVAINLE